MRSRKQSRSRANKRARRLGRRRRERAALALDRPLGGARGAGPALLDQGRRAAGREAELDLEPPPRAAALEPRRAHLGLAEQVDQAVQARERAERRAARERGLGDPAGRVTREASPRRERGGPSSRARARSASCEGESSSMCSSCSTRPRAARVGEERARFGRPTRRAGTRPRRASPPRAPRASSRRAAGSACTRSRPRPRGPRARASSDTAPGRLRETTCRQPGARAGLERANARRAGAAHADHGDAKPGVGHPLELADQGHAVGEAEHHRLDAAVAGDVVVQRADRAGVRRSGRPRGSPGRSTGRCRSRSGRRARSRASSSS